MVERGTSFAERKDVQGLVKNGHVMVSKQAQIIGKEPCITATVHEGAGMLVLSLDCVASLFCRKTLLYVQILVCPLCTYELRSS